MKQKLQKQEDLSQDDICPGGLETNPSRLEYEKGRLQGDLLDKTETKTKLMYWIERKIESRGILPSYWNI